MYIKIAAFLFFMTFILLNGQKIGEVDFRLGELSVKNNMTKGWQDIDEEDPVNNMDTLKTGSESRCEIILIDGSSFRMNENSTCIQEAYSDGDITKYKARFLEGEGWLTVNKDGKQKEFEVYTPVAVAAVIGTSYKVTHSDSSTSISVLHGKVKVNLTEEKKKELKIKPRNPYAPREVGGPKEIPGPFEVTLKEWISIVKGEVINVRNDGKYEKTKTDINELTDEWKSFRKGK